MTATVVRALTVDGIARFRSYLESLRNGALDEPPRALLHDPEHSNALSARVSVEARAFASRWGFAQYLYEQLAPLTADEVERNVGLWSWLSLYYFDALCPRRPDGVRKPGRDYRHVPDFRFLYMHRHLAYGPFAVYRRHRGHAILVLFGPPHLESALYHEITSRQDLLAGRGVIEALNRLYLDRSRGRPKRGALRTVAAPGTVRRFVRVLQQLDLTYDVYGMSGEAIVDLLPDEFAQWRAQREVAAA